MRRYLRITASAICVLAIWPGLLCGCGRQPQETDSPGSGITLACGTGAAAVCVAGVLTGRSGRAVCIHLPGGDLDLQWREDDNHVYMTGPVSEVFDGEWMGE